MMNRQKVDSSIDQIGLFAVDVVDISSMDRGRRSLRERERALFLSLSL